MINKRAQAREHEQSKRIRREEERKRMEEAMAARQREAGSARFDPGLFAILTAIKFCFVLSVFHCRKAGIGGWKFCAAPIINQYFSSRSSFDLCFCVYRVKRFSSIKSNQLRLVLIFKTRTKHQTNKQLQIRAKFSFQVLLPMKLYWIWLNDCLSLFAVMCVRKRLRDQTLPNSIRGFSAKDYLSEVRSLGIVFPRT